MRDHEDDYPSSTLMSQPSVGRLIAEARQAQGLEQADLGQRLRLDERVIRAIERDEFDELAGSTFVKGYIRSIAKELDLDPEPLLDAYRSNTGEETTPSLSDFESRPPTQISSSSVVVKSASYALVAVLLALIFFWWRSVNQQQPDGDADGPGLDVEQTSPQTPLPYEFSQVIHPEAPLYRAEDAAAETPDEFEAADPGVEGTTSSEEGIAAIELSTDSEAWVEISDSLGNALHYGIVTRDKPISLSSRPPLKFIVGNTPSVLLRINGAPLDLDTLDVEGVAKFSYPLEPGD